jgi:hypothetical protein
LKFTLCGKKSRQTLPRFTLLLRTLTLHIYIDTKKYLSPHISEKKKTDIDRPSEATWPVITIYSNTNPLIENRT